MRKKLFLLIAFISNLIAGYSAKMHPSIVTIKQKDGTELRIKFWGDEDFSYATTVDGVILYQLENDFFIASVTEDGALKPTDILAHELSLRTQAENIAISKQDLDIFRKYFEEERAVNKVRREPLTGNSTLFPHKGSPKAPVILVEFSDSTFSVNNPKESFNKYLNAEELFDNQGKDADMFNNYGSVKKYFKDISFGQFTPQFDVYGPVRLPEKLKYYGGGASSSENMNDLFKHACQLIDEEVDFSEYDSNNDGNIDLVYIIYAGYSASIGGNSTDCIHPKSGVLSNSMQFDGKTIKRYGVNNELNFSPREGKYINGIGLFVHEFSHCMGLPDLYPSTTSLASSCIDHGLDYWSIMDAGEYTYNGYRPTEYTCWERERFNWIKIDTLNTANNITLKSLSDGGCAYRVLNDKDETGKEYYLLENVQKTGWNRYIRNSGMLVYHVDYDEYSFSVGGCRVNNTMGHPRMTLIAADGMFMPEWFIGETIKPSGNSEKDNINQLLIERYNGQTITSDIVKNEAKGDPYPGITGNTSLTDNTNPSAWVYRGGTIGKPITDITEDTNEKTVSFKFMGGVDSGIEIITANNKNNNFYTLDGRKVENDISLLKNGIYISNGKKIIVK